MTRFTHYLCISMLVLIGLTACKAEPMQHSTNIATQPAALAPASGALKYGFTAFPYDLSLEAIQKVHDIILPNSNLYAIHLDQCMPWKEAAKGTPFPEWLQNDWNDIVSRIPQGHTVYIAVTPTGTDRRSMATPCSNEEGKPGDLLAEFSGKDYDNVAVQQAYLNYVKRVVEHFKPQYINIGIEMSELALQHPDEWPAYAGLYLATKAELKQQYPNLQVGMEFVLQSLMTPRVAELVKPVIDQSDYVGISFYPYGSEFGEIFGATALPGTKDGAQWKQPMDWLRAYTDKPIGICETGYTTRDFRLNVAGGIDFPGSKDLQQQFLRDLVRYAKRDNYAFVVWFISVDYEALMAKIGSAGAEWKNIWVNTGLFDADLKPKPAWNEWKKFKE